MHNPVQTRLALAGSTSQPAQVAQRARVASRRVVTARVLALVAVGAAAVACSESTDGSGETDCVAGEVLINGACQPTGSEGAGADINFGSDASAEEGAGVPDGTKDGEGGGEPDGSADEGEPEGEEGSDAGGGDEDTGGDESTEPPCTDGERECKSEKIALICADGQWQQQVCPADLKCVNGFCVQTADCEPGTVDGCLDSEYQRVCAEDGLSFVPQKCPDGLFCFEGECGTQLCEQNEKKCISPSMVGICSADKTAFDPFQDCGDTAVCVGGECESGCDVLVKFNKSYIGCEYWTADLDQFDDPFGVEKESDYAVVISNPGLDTVELTFLLPDGTSLPVVDPTVPPGYSKAFVMPTLNVDGSGISQKSVRIRSTYPVVAYQFNPLYGGGDGLLTGIASNDASLLVPTHAIGKEYYIASWPTSPNPDILNVGIQPQHGYFTVIAVEPGETTVVVKSSSHTKAGPGVAAMKPGETQEFKLQRFDVLNIESYYENIFAGPQAQDPTGTHVYSDRNIVVFGGHEQAVISNDSEATCCAEHLEEQLWPVDSWRNEFVAVKLKPRGTTTIEPDLWRVMAGADNVTITTDPPVNGVHNKVLNKGQWVEVFTTQSFEVKGTGPLQVIQYMTARDLTEQFTGDPTMILTVPTGQFRDNYSILTPPGYQEDFVTVIRPAGLSIILDGNILSDGLFAPVASGKWERAYVPLEAGVHNFNAAGKFGLIAYGWSNAVSYGYPAGLDLKSELD
jgi:hypothetical protein